MKESQIYKPLWKKYKSVIVTKMKLSVIESQEYRLSKYEFEEVGERNRSGYNFNLEIQDGVLVNNIEGSAVARDLWSVLKESNTAKELMKFYYFKINLTKDFLLTIKVIRSVM